MNFASGQAKRKDNPGAPTCGSHHSTWKATLLVSVPVGVSTVTVPVVAPVGTVASISVLETTENAAGTPLKVTFVAPVRLSPRIIAVDPAVPVAGIVFTNGASPKD